MTDYVIETQGLTKWYDDRVAVDDLDLQIRRGEIFGLLGPNGAGKTTTILMLLGLTAPSQGSARVVGMDPVHEAIQVRRRVGYLPDAVGFDEHLSGRQNLRYTARLNRLGDTAANEIIERLAVEVALESRIDDKVGTYSRGMRQRLGIADALVKGPEVLVLDEPTTAIDPEGVREIVSLISALPERSGCTVLLASHLLQQVQEVCHRVGIFIDGKLRACGDLSQLAAQGGLGPRLEVQASGGGERPIPDVVSSIPGVVDVRANELGVWLVDATRDVREEVSRALIDDGWTPTHLHLRSDDLAEVYHAFFEGDDEAAGDDGA